MFSIPINILFFILLVFGLFVCLIQIKVLKNSLKKTLASFKELDDQAKLIIKTDLELNTTQEELDKRLNGLDALQKVSRLISTTLDEEEIFRRLDHTVLTELGFEKFLILFFNEERQLRCRLNIGYPPRDMEEILLFLIKNQALVNLLGEKQSLSSLHSPGFSRTELLKVFHAHTFVMTPIYEQKDLRGLILATNSREYFSLTEGDEELISILADQISQAINNAQLFEEVFHSTQTLEKKIQDRTHELSAALDELKRISKAKSDFVSAVSHELRTPLTSIKGYAALLMAGKMGEIPENVKERLDKINKHSDNLVKFINDLLDISRIESGRVSMHCTAQNITPLFDNVRDLLTPQMKEKNINFNTEKQPALPQVFMDAPMIERVLVNLIGNAIKFTPQNGQITLRALPEKGKVAVSVIDTGIGMKSDEVTNLFSEFYRADNAINQNVKGSGLGLVLAKNIIEAHNGKIWVASKENEGSTFSFSLPIV